MHLRDKLSLHEITRRTGLARNMISRWLRVADEVVLQKYSRTEDPGKLTPFHCPLEQALKADSPRHKQNRRTGKALFPQIKKEGYEGCYSHMMAFIRLWREDQDKAPHAFVPLYLGWAKRFSSTGTKRGWYLPMDLV